MNETKTVLLVDDSENDLMLMRAAFAKAGFSHPLREVNDGEKAIAYLNGDGIYHDRNKFPLPVAMLLDLNMPRKNGFDVLAWIQGHSALKHLSTIVLTASMRTEDVVRAFDLGAHSFLVKPPTMDELVAMVRCLHHWLRINHFPPLNETVKRSGA